MRSPATLRELKQPVHLLAFGLGTGLVPRAPGTAGSLLGLGIAWLMSSLDTYWQLGIALAVTLGGIWICGQSARRLGVHDHPAIVLDEIAAMLLLACVIPAGVAWLLAAFGVFRVFDIGKPWPIRDVDHRMGGGLGIMLDDVLAAAYTAICLHIAQFALQVT